MLSSRTTKAFTLIEFLIALVIIGFIVAILVGVFSSPLKQAKTDSAIAQVKDGLRQLADATELGSARGVCSDFDCFDNAVSLGLLTAMPAIPAGITAETVWQRNSTVPGGCGANSAGRDEVMYLHLDAVSAELCAAYNGSLGLDSAPVLDCSDVSDPCSSSGSTNDFDYPSAGTTFCAASINYDPPYMIVWQTSIKHGSCEP